MVSFRVPRWISEAGWDISLGIAMGVIIMVFSGVGPSGVDRHPIDAAAAGLAVAATVAVVARRMVPLFALLAANAITVTWFLIGYDGRLITIAPLIATYTVASCRGWRLGIVGGLISIAATMVAIRSFFQASWYDDRTINAATLVAATVALGAAVHYHHAYVKQAQEQAERLAETRAEQALRLAAEERLEIARELHDVFGHTMAAVSVQAGVAVHVMNRRPHQAAEALTAIKRVSDEGLAEVQVLLAILRGEDPGTAAFPGRLAHVGKLVATTRDGNLPVEFTVSAAVRQLPVEVEVAAYRIVQESLTNVRRHARADAVWVEIDYGDRDLTVVVRDDGAGPADAADDVGGHGIVGMRMRTVELGGIFSAGRLPTGGFEVRAVLPVARETHA